MAGGSSTAGRAYLKQMSSTALIDYTVLISSPQMLTRLPGIGSRKVTSLLVLLAKQYGVELPGLATLLPAYPTLGEVRTAEELATYQAGKRAAKAAKRAAAQ
jgi:hypothetical protein